MLPFPIALTYASSKAALTGFANALEAYVYGKNIHIAKVYPGPMNTPHVQFYTNFAEGKGANPARVAKKIMRSIHKKKRCIYPDPVSKALRIVHLIMPKTLVRALHKKYTSAMYA